MVKAVQKVQEEWPRMLHCWEQASRALDIQSLEARTIGLYAIGALELWTFALEK
jgi:hypothetical protein